MAKRIRAASISVDLTANSAKFSEALDRAQRKSATSSSAIIRNLGALESFSKRFENTVSKHINKPFKAFSKATAPFRIGLRQIKASVQNVLRPFKKLGAYVAKPFVKAFNAARRAVMKLSKPLKVLSGGVAAGVALFSALVIGSSKAALEIDRLSKILGISYKDLNQLSFVAIETGLNVEQLADSMKDLTAKAQDASFAGGGALEPFFKGINESKDAWDNFSPVEQLAKFSDVLSTMNSNEQLYWADEISGSMAQLTPLLAKGGDYIRAMAKESENFGGAFNNVDGLKSLETVLKRIKFSARNIFSGIGNSLAPSIESMFQRIISSFQERMKTLGNGNVGNGFVKFAENSAKSILIGTGKILDSIQSLSETLKFAFNEIIVVANKLKKNPILLGSSAEVDSIEKRLYEAKVSELKAADSRVKLQKQIEQKEKSLLKFKKQNTITKVGSAFGGTYKTINPEVSSEVAEFESEIQKLRQAQRKSLSTSTEYNDLQKKRNELVERSNANYIKQDIGRNPTDKLSTRYGLDSASVNENFKSFNAPTASKSLVSPRTDINNTFRSATNIDGLSALGVEQRLEKFQELLLQKQSFALTTEEKIAETALKFAEEKQLIEAGIAQQISSLKLTLTNESTAVQRKAVNDEIAIIREKESVALSAIERQRANEIQALKASSEQKALIEQSFMTKLRTFKVKTGELEVNERISLIESEHLELSTIYDGQLKFIADTYGAETDMYKSMLTSKRKALDDFNTYNREQRLSDSEQDIVQSDGSLERLYTHFEDRLSAEADYKLGVSELRLSDLENASMAKEQEALKGAETEEQKTTIEKEFGDKRKANTLKLGSDLLAEGAKNSKTLFNANKALNIGNAIMDTASGATKAYAQFGWPFGAVAAGLVIASGAVQISKIKSQKFSGKAHKGQTEIDGTGDQSWILQGGERVVSREQNVDLKRYLQKANTTTNNNGGSTEVYLNNTINSSLDTDAIFMAMEDNPNRIRKMLDNL